MTINNVTIRASIWPGVWITNRDRDMIVKITDSDIETTNVAALQADSLYYAGKIDIIAVNTRVKGLVSVPIRFSPPEKGNPFHCIGVYTTVPFTLLDSSCQKGGKSR